MPKMREEIRLSYLKLWTRFALLVLKGDPTEKLEQMG